MAENKENESSAEFQLRLAHHLPRPYASGVKTSLPIRADQPSRAASSALWFGPQSAP